MWFFSRKQKSEKDSYEDFLESKNLLLDAALSTSEAAKEVTTFLQGSLDDVVRQLEITANLLSDALVICNREGIITSANKAAENLFSRQLSALINTHLTHLTNHIYVDNKKVRFSTILSLSNTQTNNIYGRSANGDLFNIDISVTSLTRQDGSTIYMMLLRDITTRIEIQKQLNVSESSYRAAFENAYDGLIIVDNFHIVSVNRKAARMMGKEPCEMIATPVLHYFAENFREEFTKVHMDAINAKPSQSKDMTVFTRSMGKDVLVSTSYMNWEGRPATLLGIKDISNLDQFKLAK